MDNAVIGALIGLSGVVLGVVLDRFFTRKVYKATLENLVLDKEKKSRDMELERLEVFKGIIEKAKIDFESTSSDLENFKEDKSYAKQVESMERTRKDIKKLESIVQSKVLDLIRTK